MVPVKATDAFIYFGNSNGDVFQYDITTSKLKQPLYLYSVITGLAVDPINNDVYVTSNGQTNVYYNNLSGGTNSGLNLISTFFVSGNSIQNVAIGNSNGSFASMMMAMSGQTGAGSSTTCAPITTFVTNLTIPSGNFSNGTNCVQPQSTFGYYGLWSDSQVVAGANQAVQYFYEAIATSSKSFPLYLPEVLQYTEASNIFTLSRQIDWHTSPATLYPTGMAFNTSNGDVIIVSEGGTGTFGYTDAVGPYGNLHWEIEWTIGNFVQGVTTDKYGNVFVAVYNQNTAKSIVWVFNGAGKQIQGLTNNLAFNNGASVPMTVDSLGNLWVGNTNNNAWNEFVYEPSAGTYTWNSDFVPALPEEYANTAIAATH